jgi:hypothetical protein
MFSVDVPLNQSPLIRAARCHSLTLMIYLFKDCLRICWGWNLLQTPKGKIVRPMLCRQELLSWVCCQWLRLPQNWSKHTCKLQTSVATVHNCTQFFAYGRIALEDSQDGVLIAPVQHSALASSRQSWHCSPPQPWHLLSKQLVTASSFESLPGSLGWRIEMNRVYNYMWLINAYSTPSSSSPPIIPNGHQTVNLSNLPQAELAKCSSKSTIQTMTKPPKTSKYIQMNYN